MDRDLAQGLSEWLRGHDFNVQAAVRLLIDHGRWLTDPLFLETAVERASGTVRYIDWDAAQKALDEGAFAATGSELAVLRLAIALGRDDFEFYRLDSLNRQRVLQAFTYAVTGRQP